MIKTEALSRSNIISIVGALANDAAGHRCIFPAFSRGYSNTVVNNGSGDYDGGDRVIGFLSYAVDGDLLITSGWGDGAAIRRLNNDGSMTKLWHDNYALYTNTTTTYNHINSLAIHKDSSQLALSTHNVNGYSMIDYSSLKTGGTTVINNRPSSQYIFSNGANIDRTGSYYCNGTETAGDWLYIFDHDATHYKKFPRRHWTNGTQELIDGTVDYYPGSAPIDRNGYRGQLIYDEVNDRMYYNFYYGANFAVILDASTATPKVLWCDLGDAGVGADGWEQGLYIEDPVNEPNKIWIGGSSRIVNCDITPCFTGSPPTILKQIFNESSTNENAYANLFRMGTKWQSTTNSEHVDKLVDHIPVHADRDRAMLGGWLDTDNLRVVAPYRYENITEDTTTGGRGRSTRFSYGQPLFKMRSANGTAYLVQVAYNFDGHRFMVWNESVGGGLIGNWSIEYGTYTLSSGNIDFVSLNTEGHFFPSGTGISYYVSNNNGSTWESYSGGNDGIHTFASVGSQLRVKYIATGNESKAPYKLSGAFDRVTYGRLYESVKNPSVPLKVTSTRLTGRK